ncbi:MAG: amidohydrolase family protein [Terracidiphilus sp.]|jgi:imidazolonepropionase-like amidohydrolase
MASDAARTIIAACALAVTATRQKVFSPLAVYKLLLGSALTIAYGLGIGHAQPTKIDRGLVLSGVTVVDTHTGGLTPDQAVVIVDGRITWIGRKDGIATGGFTQLVKAKGKFLVPGFQDMHAHVIDYPDRDDDLAVMLAYGITGWRQMGAFDSLLQQRKDGKLQLPSDSPELLGMPGDVLLRFNIDTPEKAVAEVDRQKALGADFIKTIDGSPEVFFAALEEARRDGLPFVGHLSPGVDALEASKAGMRSIEHLGPQERLLISCSTDEAMIRDVMARNRPPSFPPNMSKDAIQKMMQLFTAEPMLASLAASPESFSHLQRVVDTYNEEKCRIAAKVFVEHGTWQVPTLIRERTAEFGDDPQYTEDPNLRYVSVVTKQLWGQASLEFTARLTPQDRETLKQLMAVQLKVVKLFDDTGVRMLTGSDFGGIWLVPGFSLHQEFDQLAAAGLSPLRVLQMTTLDGAEFMGLQMTAGSVEVGKDANLVLLDGNPIESVSNLHKINAVVRAGKYYSGVTLQAMKDGAAAHLASVAAKEGVTPKP